MQKVLGLLGLLSLVLGGCTSYTMTQDTVFFAPDGKTPISEVKHDIDMSGAFTTKASCDKFVVGLDGTITVTGFAKEATDVGQVAQSMAAMAAAVGPVLFAQKSQLDALILQVASLQQQLSRSAGPTPPVAPTPPVSPGPAAKHL
jgi:hypothetical protein